MLPTSKLSATTYQLQPLSVETEAEAEELPSDDAQDIWTDADAESVASRLNVFVVSSVILNVVRSETPLIVTV
ncbi:hypothetical protein P4S72_26215 [Vibrio sp. PP-XX7]